MSNHMDPIDTDKLVTVHVNDESGTVAMPMDPVQKRSKKQAKKRAAQKSKRKNERAKKSQKETELSTTPDSPVVSTDSSSSPMTKGQKKNAAIRRKKKELKARQNTSQDVPLSAPAVSSITQVPETPTCTTAVASGTASLQIPTEKEAQATYFRATVEDHKGKEKANDHHSPHASAFSPTVQPESVPTPLLRRRRRRHYGSGTRCPLPPNSCPKPLEHQTVLLSNVLQGVDSPSPCPPATLAPKLEISTYPELGTSSTAALPQVRPHIDLRFTATNVPMIFKGNTATSSATRVDPQSGAECYNFRHHGDTSFDCASSVNSLELSKDKPSGPYKTDAELKLRRMELLVADNFEPFLRMGCVFPFTATTEQMFAIMNKFDTPITAEQINVALKVDNPTSVSTEPVFVAALLPSFVNMTTQGRTSIEEAAKPTTQYKLPAGLLCVTPELRGPLVKYPASVEGTCWLSNNPNQKVVGRLTATFVRSVVTEPCESAPKYPQPIFSVSHSTSAPAPDFSTLYKGADEQGVSEPDDMGYATLNSLEAIEDSLEAVFGTITPFEQYAEPTAVIYTDLKAHSKSFFYAEVATSKPALMKGLPDGVSKHVGEPPIGAEDQTLEPEIDISIDGNRRDHTAGSEQHKSVVFLDTIAKAGGIKIGGVSMMLYFDAVNRIKTDDGDIISIEVIAKAFVKLAKKQYRKLSKNQHKLPLSTKTGKVREILGSELLKQSVKLGNISLYEFLGLLKCDGNGIATKESLVDAFMAASRNEVKKLDMSAKGVGKVGLFDEIFRKAFSTKIGEPA